MRIVGVITLLIIVALKVKAGPCTNERYNKIFSDILAVAGYSKDDIKLVCTDEVSNARFDSIPGQKIIEINPNYFLQQKEVVFVGAICHEIGHAKLGHRGLTTPDQEKQADYYCGFYMKKLAFSSVEEALECLVMTPTEGTDVYPPRETRTASISNGWSAAEKEITVYSYSTYNPRVIWEIKGRYLIVTIDDRELKLTFWYNHGGVYDSLTGSTYQLLDYRNRQGACGIGRLVTNKSSMTYTVNKWTRKGGKFSIYQDGKELEIDQCVHDKVLEPVGSDLEIPCWNEIYKTNIIYVLKDYMNAPLHYFLPVYTKKPL